MPLSIAINTFPIFVTFQCIAIALGLKCYNCNYQNVEGVRYGDLSCKDGQHIRQNATTNLVPCNEEKDAMNFETIEVTKVQDPSATFRLGCLTAQIEKKPSQDIMIRGCYARKNYVKPEYDLYYEPTTTPPATVTEPPPPPPLACGLPGPLFWADLREGKFSLGPVNKTKTPLEITSAKLTSCFCDDGDGCNSAPNTRGDFIYHVLMLLISLHLFPLMS